MNSKKLTLTLQYAFSFLLCTIFIINSISAQTERIVIELPKDDRRKIVLSKEEQSNLQAQEHEINQFFQDLNLESHPDYYTLKLIKSRTRSARTLAINPAGTMLAAGYSSNKKSLVFYTIRQDGTIIAQPSVNNDAWKTITSQYITALAFTTDGKQLAVGGWEKIKDKKTCSIYLWSLADNSYKKLGEHTDVVKDLACNHEGTLLASTADDYTLQLLDLTNFTQRGLYDWREENGENKWGYSVSFNSTDKLIAVSQENSVVKIFEVEKFLGTDNIPVIEISFKYAGVESAEKNSMAIARFSPDNPLLLAISYDTYCVLLNLETQTYRFLYYSQHHEDAPQYHALRFNQMGNLIATRDQRGIIYCWEVDDSNCVGIGFIKWFWNYVHHYEDLAFLPNDSIITSGEITNRWDLAQGIELQTSAYFIVWKKLFSPHLNFDYYFKNRTDRFNALKKYLTPAAVNEYFENQEIVKSEPLSPPAIRAEVAVPMEEADQQEQLVPSEVDASVVEIAIEQPEPVPSSAEAHIAEEKSAEAGYVTKFKNFIVNALQQTWNVIRSASYAGYQWIRNRFS